MPPAAKLERVLHFGRRVLLNRGTLRAVQHALLGKQDVALVDYDNIDPTKPAPRATNHIVLSRGGLADGKQCLDLARGKITFGADFLQNLAGDEPVHVALLACQAGAVHSSLKLPCGSMVATFCSTGTFTSRAENHLVWNELMAQNTSPAQAGMRMPWLAGPGRLQISYITGNSLTQFVSRVRLEGFNARAHMLEHLASLQQYYATIGRANIKFTQLTDLTIPEISPEDELKFWYMQFCRKASVSEFVPIIVIAKHMPHIFEQLFAQQERYDFTPIILYAALAGRADVLAAMQAIVPCADAISVSGMTALQQAVSDNNLEAVRLLLELGANANYQDNNGCSSLHWAALRASKAISLALLEYGAQPDLRDNEGRTSYQVAMARCNYDCIQALNQHRSPSAKPAAASGHAVEEKLLVNTH